MIKSKAKPGPKKKKIDEFHPDRRKNLAESDMCPGTILDISGATRPFTASCTTLNALVKVASKEVTIEPDKI